MFTVRYVLHSTFCPHSVFMYFVWIWEQTAIISLYGIDWLVFITETECLLRGTDWVFIWFGLVLVFKAWAATHNAVLHKSSHSVRQSVTAYWHYSAGHYQSPSFPTAGLSTVPRRNDAVRDLPATVCTVAHLATYPHIESQFDCCNRVINLVTELPLSSR